jgi:acetylornithine deacetylase/succinyl-diaminopimelate desuccinylase-like protein
MEIRVEVKGISCHGSAPERGDNAIYKMADIIQEVRALNDRSIMTRSRQRDPCRLGNIYNSPSRCAVADMPLYLSTAG